MIQKVFTIVLLLISTNTYSQKNEHLNNITIDDFNIQQVDSSATLIYLNDISNLTYDYRVRSRWYAGALDNYFTANYKRDYRIFVDPAEIGVNSKIKLFNCIEVDENLEPKFLKVTVYERSNNKINKVRIKKKLLELSQEGNRRILSLSFLKNYTNKVIVDISYRYKSIKKSDINWFIDNYERYSASFNVFIPEIYLHNAEVNPFYEKSLNIQKTKEVGPLIGYEMTVGSSSSGYKLFPKEWAEKDKSRSYVKVYCNLNSYIVNLSHITQFENHSNNILLTWKLLDVNEIDIK